MSEPPETAARPPRADAREASKLTTSAPPTVAPGTTGVAQWPFAPNPERQ
jgi:hypothetical protein